MSTSPSWDRVQGDINDTLVAQLDGVVDLAGVSAIVGHVWRPGTAATNLAASVLNAVDRTVTVELSPWLATATVGAWFFEIQATSGSLTVTWPEASPAIIRVRAQGG